MEVLDVTTFTLGKSTVVTIPKKLGIGSGVKLKLSKKGSAILLEPKSKSKRDEIAKKIALVKKLAGGIKIPFPYTPDELNKMIDDEYDEIIVKKVLLRR